jgi:DNA-binding transcriptional MerR regulator
MEQRLGVTAKALRLYERLKLIQPVRTSAGWRAYGPEQVGRLHQILALKQFGFSLKDIGELLTGRLGSLDSVLALQQQVLTARRAEMDHALTLLSAARGQLAQAGALSPDDLIELTKETIVMDKLNDAEWAETFQPLVDKHYSPQEQAALKARKLSSSDETDFKSAWDRLLVRAARRQAQGDPGSDEAKALARDWMSQVRQFTCGDPALETKSAAMWQEAVGQPEFARRSGFTPELMAFVGEAWRRAQAPEHGPAG